MFQDLEARCAVAVRAASMRPETAEYAYGLSALFDLRQWPYDLTGAFDEEFDRGAEGSVLQSKDCHSLRRNTQVDWQHLYRPALRAKSQRRILHYCEKTPRRKQVGANVQRKGGDVPPRQLQTVRAERVYYEWNGSAAWGVQNPRFICQFCKRELATACPSAPRSGDHKTSVLEEDFARSRPTYSRAVMRWRR